MAQRKLKAKSSSSKMKIPPNVHRNNAARSKVTKKSQKAKLPKKGQHGAIATKNPKKLLEAKFQTAVTKALNAHIEADTKSKATSSSSITSLSVMQSSGTKQQK